MEEEDQSQLELDMESLEDEVNLSFLDDCGEDGATAAESPSIFDDIDTFDDSLTRGSEHGGGGAGAGGFGGGGSMDDMSQISFDSATYAAATHGMSQWELLMKIADSRRLPSDMDMSVSAYSSNTKPFSIKDKEDLETKQGELQFEIDSLKERLKRRNILIGTIREAYLKDVIELKTVMFGVLTESERLRVVSQWDAVIPSLDLRKPIELCAPAEAEFTHVPCEACGGQVLITVILIIVVLA